MKPIRATWQRLAGSIGRRGCSMLFLALLDLVYGWSICAAPAETRVEAGYRYITSLLPADAWAAAWVIVGLICLTCAFRAQDRAGFAAASALKAGWGLVFLCGWFHGVPRGYASAAVWLAAAAWLLIISTWPEAPPRRPGRDGGTDGR